MYDHSFFNICGCTFIRGSIFGEICLKIKHISIFGIQTGIGPLLEHGPVIEILRYMKFNNRESMFGKYFHFVKKKFTRKMGK